MSKLTQSNYFNNSQIYKSNSFYRDGGQSIVVPSAAKGWLFILFIFLLLHGATYGILVPQPEGPVPHAVEAQSPNTALLRNFCPFCVYRFNVLAFLSTPLLYSYPVYHLNLLQEVFLDPWNWLKCLLSLTIPKILLLQSWMKEARKTIRKRLSQSSRHCGSLDQGIGYRDKKSE